MRNGIRRNKGCDNGNPNPKFKMLKFGVDYSSQVSLVYPSFVAAIRSSSDS
jgi:hypothetical protein